MPGSKPTSGDAAKPRRRVKLTRAERSQRIRQSLMDAAATVVGTHGYADAMISMITAHADVAQGTFYNYFGSRQDLFDELLPQIGQEMLGFIAEEISGSANDLEREERSFRAFFTFLRVRPEFYRILYEAELFAPAAFARHMETVAAGYVRMLKRAASNGALRVDEPRELEGTAFMLMGIRYYLCMRFARREGTTISLPEWVVHLYLGLVTSGVYIPTGSEAPRRG